MPEYDVPVGDPRLFRGGERVTLRVPGQPDRFGWGYLSALSDNAALPPLLRHPAGDLRRPLYRFTGALPLPAEGAEATLLAPGDRRYTVLDGRAVRLGSRVLCVRLRLEPLADEEVDG